MRDHRRLLALIVALSAVLRLSGIAWDGWAQQHPDERFLTMVAEALALPHSVAETIDPARATLNPNNRGFDFYVYGALPPAVNRIVASALGIPEGAGRLAASRLLACAADMVTLWLVFLLGTRFGGGRAGLLAAALYGACPLMIQQSRFATVDSWGVMFATAVIAVSAGRDPAPRRWLGAGALAGLAAACKPNLALVGIVPLVELARWAWSRRMDGSSFVAASMARLATLGAGSLAAIKLADPGAFAAWWSVLPNPRRIAALRQLAGIVSGAGQFPPNLQWADRRAVLDPLVNLLGWGTGPLLGIAILFGAVWVVRRAALGDGRWWGVLAWAVPVTTLHLFTFVSSVRHFEPVVPVLVAAAGCWLARRRALVQGGVVLGTVVVAVAWASIAWRPYTRIDASRWLDAHLPSGATVTAEYWDDALPIPIDGLSQTFRIETMRVFDPDTDAKREEILAALDRADAVVLASQRGVGSICRVPDAYPLTSEYYHLLFSGALGFRLAEHVERRIGFGALSFSDLGAEESLSVYDHPPVWIFVKTGAYSPDLARRLLERPELGRADWTTRGLEARGEPPWSTSWRAQGRLPELLGRSWPSQVIAVLLWIAWIELLGLAGRWVLLVVAPALPDGGWGAARWLGLALAGVVWLWLGWLRVPAWNGALPLVVTLAALPWAIPAGRRAWRDPRYRLAAIVVWGVFLLFLAIRAGNPEIYWGEKPMDSAILTSLWRGGGLPPGEPWFAGSPLQYYFFGFLPYALGARTLGVAPGVAFNLAAATVPALTAGCALAVGWLLSRRWRGGVLTAVLVQLTGTAAVLFRPALITSTDFNAFWATSRVIPGTINEYPVWSALFADLHAHYFGFPGFMSGILLASALATGILRRRGAWLVGVVLAVESMTNTWELPALAALVGLALLFRRSRRDWRGMVGGAGWCGRIAFAAVVAGFPYWISVRGGSAGVAWGGGAATAPIALLELFGVPLALCVVALAATMASGSRRPELTWAWAVIGVGVLWVLLPDVVTVADHMNTVFKLHLQAYLLLGAGLGAVLAATLPDLGRRWRRLTMTGVAAVVTVGLATSMSDARIVLATRRVAGPRPTLDGEAYLPVAFPREAAVLGSLAERTPAGPVIEPAGPPYGDSLRVPMFTGMPAVVGWEYHLWQRRRAWSDIRMRQEDLAVLQWGQDRDIVAALARRYRLLGAVSWDGKPPAVARLLHWTAVPGAQGAWMAQDGGVDVTP